MSNANGSNQYQPNGAKHSVVKPPSRNSSSWLSRGLSAGNSQSVVLRGTAQVLR